MEVVRHWVNSVHGMKCLPGPAVEQIDVKIDLFLKSIFIVGSRSLFKMVEKCFDIFISCSQLWAVHEKLFANSLLDEFVERSQLHLLLVQNLLVLQLNSLLFNTFAERLLLVACSSWTIDHWSPWSLCWTFHCWSKRGLSHVMIQSSLMLSSWRHGLYICALDRMKVIAELILPLGSTIVPGGKEYGLSVIFTLAIFIDWFGCVLGLNLF
jgi:hypothetical protein